MCRGSCEVVRPKRSDSGVLGWAFRIAAVMRSREASLKRASGEQNSERSRGTLCKIASELTRGAGALATAQGKGERAILHNVCVYQKCRP